MQNETQPVGGCRYFAVSGCFLGLAAILLVVLTVAAIATGLAWLVTGLWSSF
jgi:hypothetical protein